MILYDDRVPGELARAKATNDELLRACLALGGSVTGEHGVGVDKALNLTHQYAPADLNFMARLRSVFDPDGIMNPGKLLPSHPACGEGLTAHCALPAPGSERWRSPLPRSRRACADRRSYQSQR
jgi:glycolate oxidase